MTLSKLFEEFDVPEWAGYVTFEPTDTGIKINYYRESVVGSFPIGLLPVAFNQAAEHLGTPTPVVAEFTKQERYLAEDGERDYIDRSYEHLPWPQFVGAIRWTIDKYFDRLGKKDSLITESRKIADYAQRFHGKVLRYCAENKITEKKEKPE